MLWLLCCLLATTAPVSAVPGERPLEALPQVDRDEARARGAWERGAQAYRDGRLLEAIAALEESYRYSGRTGALFSLGQAHRRRWEHEQDHAQRDAPPLDAPTRAAGSSRAACMLHGPRAMLEPMRTAASISALVILGALAGIPAASAGQPAPQPAPTVAPVDDAAWSALQGRQVVIETPSGAVGGELLRSDGNTLVLLQADGRVLTVAKAEATGVRVVQPHAGGGSTTPVPAPTPAPTPAPAPAPATTPATTPVPTATAPTATTTPAPAATDPAAAEEELTPGEQRRKERREKREHAILGAFTMQGATYTHWRGSGVDAGHASYAMDFGVGANLSPGFGMYAVAGGLLGAKIDDEQTNANYGHVVALFAFGGKHYYSTVGAGVAFSRLRFPGDRLEKETGLALPFKLVGKIPLPKKLYLGLGLTYELGMVGGFTRFVNGIGGQIVFGRW
jgi:hypothetical protein